MSGNDYNKSNLGQKVIANTNYFYRRFLITNIYIKIHFGSNFGSGNDYKGQIWARESLQIQTIFIEDP